VLHIYIYDISHLRVNSHILDRLNGNVGKHVTKADKVVVV